MSAVAESPRLAPDDIVQGPLRWWSVENRSHKALVIARSEKQAHAIAMSVIVGGPQKVIERASPYCARALAPGLVWWVEL